MSNKPGNPLSRFFKKHFGSPKERTKSFKLIRNVAGFVGVSFFIKYYAEEISPGSIVMLTTGDAAAAASLGYTSVGSSSDQESRGILAGL